MSLSCVSQLKAAIFQQDNKASARAVDAVVHEFVTNSVIQS